MKNKFLIVLATFTIALFSCKPVTQNEPVPKSDTLAAVTKVKVKPFANVVFASRKDTTCGMPISAGVEDTLVLKDKIYGFCSKECKDEFASILKTQKKR